MRRTSLDGSMAEQVQDLVTTKGAAEMAEQRVPNLEEMDEREAHRFLSNLYSRHIPEEEYNVRHPEDYVMEMPSQGSASAAGRTCGRSRKPTPPSFLQVRRVLVKEGP